MNTPRFTAETDDDAKSFSEQVATCSRILESPYPKSQEGVAARFKLLSLAAADPEVLQELSPGALRSVAEHLRKLNGSGPGSPLRSPFWK
jgi:hypothetical protein